MRLTYQRDMAHNYMVPEISAEGMLEDYQISMLTENQPEGLLALCVRSLDGKSYFFYEITSKQSMERICEKERLGVAELRSIWRGLYLALTEIQRYLLDADHLVLEPETVYMDIETKQPEFCFLPVYRKDFAESFRGFAEYLLQHLDQSDHAAVLLGYEVYRASMEEYCGVWALLKKVIAQERVDAEREKLPGDRRETVKNIETDAGREWETHDRARMRKVPETADENRDGQGIPRSNRGWEESSGAQAQEEPNVTRENGSWGGKDSTRAERTARGSRRPKKALHVLEKGERRFRKSAAASVALLCAAALCLGALYWAGHLNVTQLGGVVFLCAGVTGYLCSAGKKQKKTAAQQVREREKKAAKKVETSRRQEKPSPPERIAAAGKSQPVLADCETAAETSRIVPEYRKNAVEKTLAAAPVRQTPQEERFGATTVLFEGSRTYEPHLGLISMNPKERDSVVLVKDSYVIGKLKSKCDICLKDEAVSRIHAQIIKEEDAYYLCDLNSTNGTFLNGKRLAVNEKAKLALTDEISFAGLGYYVGKC